LMTGIAVLGARPMLELMKTPDNIIDDAVKYIAVIYWGIVAAMAYNMAAGILRALGDSKTPLYFLIVSSILNVILDIVFIVVFNSGVVGAAYATVIAQGVSALLCILYIIRKFPILHLHKKDWTFSFSLAGRLFSIGLPMALQFSITAIGVMVLQSAVNGFGSTAVGAYTAASKVEQLATQPMQTLGTTMATYCGQNMGASRYDRIKAGMHSASIIAIATTVFAILVVVLGGNTIVGWFVSNPTEDVLHWAQTYLRTISFFFIFLSFLFLYRNALQGVGLSFVPLMAGVGEFVTRIIMALFFAQNNYVMICLASPFAWIAAYVLLAIKYYFYSSRELKMHIANMKS
ncbi:MAG: MATE family efflux transporter, partial [Lachnospiraceae bacterium]